MCRILALVPIGVLAVCSYAAGPPQAEISNQQIHAKLYSCLMRKRVLSLDPLRLVRRDSQFDFPRARLLRALVRKYDPSVRDFAYRDGEIVVGAVSAMTGPVDEFQKPLGYDAAKAGGTFVKVGVGVLRKPDETAYVAMKPFEIVDSGEWTVRKRRTRWNSSRS